VKVNPEVIPQTSINRIYATKGVATTDTTIFTHIGHFVKLNAPNNPANIHNKFSGGSGLGEST